MNWQSIVVLAVLAAGLAAIVAMLIINRRKGKIACSCGSGCSECPMSGKCHK